MVPEETRDVSSLGLVLVVYGTVVISESFMVGVTRQLLISVTWDGMYTWRTVKGLLRGTSTSRAALEWRGSGMASSEEWKNM